MMNSRVTGWLIFAACLLFYAAVTVLIMTAPVEAQPKAAVFQEAVGVVNLSGQEWAKVKCAGDEVIYTPAGPNEGVLTCRVWVGQEK